MGQCYCTRPCLDAPYSVDNARAGNFGKNSPIKRPAQRAEIAPAYVFLASKDNSYIAGATIAITGGKVAF